MPQQQLLLAQANTLQCCGHSLVCASVAPLLPMYNIIYAGWPFFGVAWWQSTWCLPTWAACCCVCILLFPPFV
jgi:hypothetical protein